MARIEAQHGHRRSDRIEDSGIDTGRTTFIRRALIGVGIVTAAWVILFLLWNAVDVFLLVFAGLLFAVFLRMLSDPISDHTPIASGWALAIVVLALLAAIGLGGWFVFPSVAQQTDELAQALPRAADQVRQYLGQFGWMDRILQQAPSTQELITQRLGVFSRVTGIVSTVLGAVTSLVIVLFIGLYLAADPGLYRAGIVHLVPKSKRLRTQEILSTIWYNLRWWLVGRLASMAIVAVLTTVGLWLIGVPLALVLGLLAGLLEWIPNLGPILAAVPGILIALSQGTTVALYTALLYIAVQAIESYVITPLVLKRVVSLPPVVTLTAVVLFGVLFGFLGILIATPVATVIMVLVKMLYVEDILDDEAIEVDGEDRVQQEMEQDSTREQAAVR